MTTSSAQDRATVISPSELRELIPTSTVRVLDVRWELAQPDGRAAFELGHVPGAVYCDLESELSDHSGPAGRGRHPLPSVPNLELALRRWGVNAGDSIVVYDDWNRAGSSRAWWVLRAAGLTDVRILDGGWSAWVGEGGDVEVGATTTAAGSIAIPYDDLSAGALPTLTEADALRTATESTLLDARAPERFRGEVEPVDPVAGHIPGAVNLPSTSLLGAEGRFASAEDLRALFTERIGDERAGVYCGSGVTAAVVIAAADIAGVDLALFPGSWSQWSANPENPVATGA